MERMGRLPPIIKTPKVAPREPLSFLEPARELEFKGEQLITTNYCGKIGMKPLWLQDISGLYQEFYQPDSRFLMSNSNVIDGCSLDAGSMFWSKMLQKDKIIRLVETLEDNFNNPINQTPQFMGIVSNKNKFIENVLDAKITICDQGIDQCSFFNKLETLAIVCELYTKFETYPFVLTLESGFLLNEVSAATVVHDSLNCSKNPYLQFIRETVIGLIQDYRPDVLFCAGKISHFNIATARLAKQIFPDIHISITRHSSEYYSLNKIEN